VGLGCQGIAEKENQVDLAVGNPGSDFLVTAQRAGPETFDIEAGGFDDSMAGGAGREQFVFLQRVAVFEGEIDYFRFHFVMGDKRYFHMISPLLELSLLFIISHLIFPMVLEGKTFVFLSCFLYFDLI